MKYIHYTVSPCEQGTEQTFEQGLSKREYIAARLLPAVFAYYIQDGVRNGEDFQEVVANITVGLADKLLAKLEGAPHE